MDLVISLMSIGVLSISTMHVRHNDKKRNNRIWPFNHFGKRSERQWSTKTQGIFMGETMVTWRTSNIEVTNISLVWFGLVLHDDGHGMSSYPKAFYFKGKVKNVKHVLNMKVKLKKDISQVHEITWMCMHLHSLTCMVMNVYTMLSYVCALLL